MPLKLKLRGRVWKLEGRIDEIPNSDYYRKSTRKTERKDAEIYLAWFRQQEIKAHYVGREQSFIFAAAVSLYEASPEFATYLLRVMPYLEHLEVTEIKPKMIRDLGPKISPMNSTDTWHKQLIVPVRAVINNAHQLDLCPPIVIKSYSKDERQKQDRLRGKQSRVPKTPGNWNWVLKFKATADPYTGLLCQFMFETAARISQAIKLKPSNIDYEKMRVFMPEAKGMPAQWVTISPELTAELKALPPKCPKHQYKKYKQFEERVFGYAARDSVYKKWKRICRKANIDPLMPHSAGRHGFATEMLVRNKLDPNTVAKTGRWADVSLLMNTYAHSEDAEEKVQQAIRTGRVQAESVIEVNSLNNMEKLENDD